MTKLSSYAVGDVLILTTMHRAGTQRREVEVTCVDWKGNGYVTWGVIGDLGSGAFKPFKPGTRGPYGLIAVENTGRKVTR